MESCIVCFFASGFCVERPDELEDAVRAALRYRAPALTDVVTARQELFMPPTVNIQEVRGFGTFMAKTVLDGRLGELIGLAVVRVRIRAAHNLLSSEAPVSTSTQRIA